MKDLLELIAKSLVDRPDSVDVAEVEEDGAIVLELSVDPDDLGKVIGRHGRTAHAIRALLETAGQKQKKEFILEILE
jgi:predicted RNA-binding protein YlqC (UPF0109 family)